MKPADLGYSMPAEWAPHLGCWMGWPARESIWHGYIDPARNDYARVAQAIARFEPLTMLANPEHVDDASLRCGPNVRVVPLPIDDSWLRDSGPTFVLDAAGARAASAFTFNAWGAKCRPFNKDAAVGARVAALAGVTTFRSDLVVEGGGFLSDGEGTLITAESCVLNPNRNPGWNKARADAELRHAGGAQDHLAPGAFPRTPRRPTRCGAPIPTARWCRSPCTTCSAAEAASTASSSRSRTPRLVERSNNRYDTPREMTRGRRYRRGTISIKGPS